MCKNCENCTLFKTGNPVFTECVSKKLTDEEKEKNIIATNENEEIDLGCRGWKYNGI